MGTNECSQSASEFSWDSQDFGDVRMVLKMVRFRKSTSPGHNELKIKPSILLKIKPPILLKIKPTSLLKIKLKILLKIKPKIWLKIKPTVLLVK